MPRALSSVSMESGMLLDAAPLEEAEDRQADLMQQSFDEYLSRVQAQPDDEDASEALSSLMHEAFQAGDVDFLMHNAMVLAAMACTDPHMEDLANEAGSLFSQASNPRFDEHGHDHDDSSERPESQGKTSSKKKARTARSLAWLLFNYQPQPVFNTSQPVSAAH